MLFESKRSASWPPYHLVERSIEEKAKDKLDKLERLYHVGQDNIWDGREVLAAMEADLRAAQKAGLLRPQNPRLTARFLLGGIAKIVLAALADDEPVDLDAIVKAVVDLEMFGLLKDEVRT